MTAVSKFTLLQASWLGLETLVFPLVVLVFPKWFSFLILGVVNFWYIVPPDYWSTSHHFAGFMVLQPYMYTMIFKHRSYTTIPLFWIGTMLGRQMCLVENTGVFKDFVLVPSKMKKWGWSQWFILYTFSLLILVWMYSQYIDQANVSKIQWYGLVALTTLITVLTIAIKDHYELHLHHFFVFAVILSMSVCSGTLGAILDGVFYGFYVDGIAEWGLAPIWQPK